MPKLKRIDGNWPPWSAAGADLHNTNGPRGVRDSTRPLEERNANFEFKLSCKLKRPTDILIYFQYREHREGQTESQRKADGA